MKKPNKEELCDSSDEVCLNVRFAHYNLTLYPTCTANLRPHLPIAAWRLVPLTKGRRLAERNLGKNEETTLTENPEAPLFLISAELEVFFDHTS